MRVVTLLVCLLWGCSTNNQQCIVNIEATRFSKDRILDVRVSIVNMSNTPVYLLRVGSDAPEFHIKVFNCRGKKSELYFESANAITHNWLDLVPSYGEKILNLSYILSPADSVDEAITVIARDPFGHEELKVMPIGRIGWGVFPGVVRKNARPLVEMNQEEIYKEKEMLIAVNGIGPDWDSARKTSVKYLETIHE